VGGKRPDQYQLAPDEAAHTDYKWSEVDLGTQSAARSRVRARGRQLIPPAVPEPGAERQAEDLEARHARHRRKQNRTRSQGRRKPRG
jgi:hypothetical protein